MRNLVAIGIVGVAALFGHAAAAPKKLGYADFWSVAGVSRTDTTKTVVSKWGKATGSDERQVHYAAGPTIAFDHDPMLGEHVQIDYSVFGDPKLAFAKKYRAKTPGLSLVGMTCDAAAKRLAFTDTIKDYTTCKHYDPNGWMVDVTLTCTSAKVTGLTVVWAKYPEAFAKSPLPEDHCN